jgi:hypothetical protein
VLCVLAVAASAAGTALGRQVSHHRLDTATSGCFQYSVRTDHTSYPLGTPVNVLVTATNVSTQPCRGRSCGGITPSFEVFNAAGKSVYTSGGVGIACVRNPPPPAMIQPGHAEAWTDGPWDQLGLWTGPCKPGNCHPTRTQAPPGPYRITWRWLDTLSVSTAWFWLSS